MTKIKSRVPALRFPEFKGEWEEKRLGKILIKQVDPVDVDIDTYYREIGIRSHGKGLFYKEPILGKDLGNKRVFWIKEEAFIVNIVFAWEQAVAKTTEKEKGMIASHRFPMYIPKKDAADVDYILHFFLTRKGKRLLELASPGGAGRNKTLGQKEFDKLSLTLPLVSEQTKIASFLTAIDAQIQLLKLKKDKLEAYKRGVMQQIFSQKLRFKNEEGNYYEKWKEKKLGKIGVTYNGLTGKIGNDFGEGEPYIQYKQILDDSKIAISKCANVNIGDNENQNKVQYGDVFFTISSETPNEIGYSSVLLDNVENMYLNSFSFGFRPHNLAELYPPFAKYLFRSSSVRKDIIKLAQGSTRYNMSKNQFVKILIQYPSLPEQKKTANFLCAIDDKSALCDEQITKSQEYKDALLQQMFV